MLKAMLSDFFCINSCYVLSTISMFLTVLDFRYLANDSTSLADN